MRATLSFVLSLFALFALVFAAPADEEGAFTRKRSIKRASEALYNDRVARNQVTKDRVRRNWGKPPSPPKQSNSPHGGACKDYQDPYSWLPVGALCAGPVYRAGYSHVPSPGLTCCPPHTTCKAVDIWSKNIYKCLP